MNEILRAEAVAFGYPQDGRGLAPVSLQLSPGEILHISSPSGGGKSTLARSLTGLIPHLYHGQMQGEVWLCGQRTDQQPLWALSEMAGLVMQNPTAQMLAPSVEEEIIFGLENLGLPTAEIDRRVDQALAEFGLQSMRRRTPQTLSGGEQQKLALAAITARRPPVLVLDEPLSMLDTTAAFDLIDLIARQSTQGTAVAICEHRHEYLSALAGLKTLELSGAGATIASESSLEWPGERLAEQRLQARGLRVERGGRLILDGWDFCLPGGKVVAFVGRNGVGKTTLLRAIAGLQPYSGELRLLENGLNATPNFGIVFQNPDLQLFNASVHDEILYAVPNPDTRLYERLLRALDLERYAQTPPLLLSEGEKRRVALATALMHKPRHGILLDEPALGQDQDHKRMLIGLLRSLAGTGQMVVYSTHDIELAAQAHQLFLLGSTGILAAGSPREVFCQAGAWEQAGLRLPDWAMQRC
ncbi:MAG: ABC transporter ATP-binding protein [Chloroflexota bacterium]